MDENKNFDGVLENFQYNIINANNRVLNGHLDNNQMRKELENTKKELENIRREIQNSKNGTNNNSQNIINQNEIQEEDSTNVVATSEIYALKEETKSIVNHLDELLKQVEKINEINAHMLELVEMKDAVIEHKNKTN